MADMPVEEVGRRTLGTGDNADDIRLEREASICTRIALADGMYSPYIRLNDPVSVKGQLPQELCILR
jgi:hypothetical protein